MSDSDFSNANIHMKREDSEFYVWDKDWNRVGIADTFPQALKNLAEKYPDELH